MFMNFTNKHIIKNLIFSKYMALLRRAIVGQSSHLVRVILKHSLKSFLKSVLQPYQGLAREL